MSQKAAEHPIPEPLQRKALSCRSHIADALQAIRRLHRALDKIEANDPDRGGHDGREDDGR